MHGGVKEIPLVTGIYGKDIESTYLYERWWKEPSHKDLELAHLWQRLVMQKWVVLSNGKKCSKHLTQIWSRKTVLLRLKMTARHTQGLLVKNIIVDLSKNLKVSKKLLQSTWLWQYNLVMSVILKLEGKCWSHELTAFNIPYQTADWC